jgi:hypothetical protein
MADSGDWVAHDEQHAVVTTTKEMHMAPRLFLTGILLLGSLGFGLAHKQSIVYNVPDLARWWDYTIGKDVVMEVTVPPHAGAPQPTQHRITYEEFVAWLDHKKTP